MLIPAIDQFATEYAVTLPYIEVRYRNEHFLQLTVPSGSEKLVSLNETSLENEPWTTVPGMSFSMTNKLVAFGTQFINGLDGTAFGVTAYGYGLSTYERKS